MAPQGRLLTARERNRNKCRQTTFSDIKERQLARPTNLAKGFERECLHVVMLAASGNLFREAGDRKIFWISRIKLKKPNLSKQLGVEMEEWHEVPSQVFCSEGCWMEMIC